MLTEMGNTERLVLLASTKCNFLVQGVCRTALNSICTFYDTTTSWRIVLFPNRVCRKTPSSYPDESNSAHPNVLPVSPLQNQPSPLEREGGYTIPRFRIGQRTGDAFKLIIKRLIIEENPSILKLAIKCLLQLPHTLTHFP